MDFVFSDALGRPIDQRSDHQAWQDLLKKARLPPKKLHAARHSCGTFMAGIGIPMSTIKDAYGHSSIKVTERYVNTPREGLRSAMDLVDATFFGTPANNDEPERTETETAFGLLTFDQVVGKQSREGNWSRLGEPSLVSSPPRTYALRARSGIGVILWYQRFWVRRGT